MKNKKRLDLILQKTHPEFSRNQIQSFIMQGKIKVDDQIVTKPGTQVDEKAKIEVNIEIPKFVCRAGFKLEKALDYFKINPENLVILDAGLSTGGFTDCLLQRGAAKVYGIDVGYGQVHEKIRENPKVIVQERTNLRHLDISKIEKVDLVTLDLSFISVLKVIEVVAEILKNNGQLIVLIKPQFEAERHQVGKGGIIKDFKVHQEVIEKVTNNIISYGFKLIGVTESPITGATGNKEFLAYFIKTPNCFFDKLNILV